MDRERFENDIQEVESRVKDHPEEVKRAVRGAYGRLQFLVAVSLLACLGSAVALGLYAALSPSTVSFLLAAVPGIPLAVFGILLLVSLAFRGRVPRGVLVKREDSPQLFDLIELLLSKVTVREDTDDFDEMLGSGGGADIDEVHIVPEFNVAVLQSPRCGVFGCYKRYLILGLPMMEAISPWEFRAVLAHEISHLSNRSEGFDSWVYRVRSTWERLMDRLGQGKPPGGRLVRSVLYGAWRKFETLAFPLCRELEYEADRFSISMASDDHLASVLARIEVVACQYEKAWETVGEELHAQAEGSGRVFDEIQAHIAAQYSDRDARAWLARSLLRTSDYSDTHPSLIDRLVALKMEPDQALIEAARAGNHDILPAIAMVPHEKSAAHTLFSPDQLQKFRDTFNREWVDGVGEHWKLQHHAVKEAKETTQPEIEAGPDPSAKAMPAADQ